MCGGGADLAQILLQSNLKPLQICNMHNRNYESLSNLVYDQWRLLASMNMLPGSELGIGVFVHLIKHAFAEEALSMKDLNADAPGAISGIRRTINDLENNAWVTRVASPDDERVVIVRPTEKLKQRVASLLEKTSAELDDYFDRKASHTGDTKSHCCAACKTCSTANSRASLT